MSARQHELTQIGAHPDHATFARKALEGLPPLLNVPRVARILDISRRRVYELVERGDLAAVRHGTRGLRVFRDSLRDWLERGGSGPAITAKQSR